MSACYTTCRACQTCRDMSADDVCMQQGRQECIVVNLDAHSTAAPEVIASPLSVCFSSVTAVSQLLLKSFIYTLHMADEGLPLALLVAQWTFASELFASALSERMC